MNEALKELHQSTVWFLSQTYINLGYFWCEGQDEKYIAEWNWNIFEMTYKPKDITVLTKKDNSKDDFLSTIYQKLMEMNFKVLIY